MTTLYERAPQMRDYEALDPVLHPYLGFISPANFRSSSVSTDGAGFRVSEFGGKLVSTESAPRDEGLGVALGASFMFGVGATEDGRSIVSRLAEGLGKPVLNRAVRAGNSMQELLAALPVLDRAEDVVVCTGANNLGLACSSSRTYDGLGPLFYDERFALLAGRPLDEVAAALSGTRLVDSLRSRLAARGGDHASRPAPPRLDAEAITSAAAERHIRDLALVAAAAPPAARVLFVVQPFADPRLREPHADERGLLDQMNGPAAEWWGSTMNFIGEHWESYTEKLRSGCERIGVRFGVLEASAFEGWAFVDRVHMTDEGQEQAARKIVEMMSHGAA